MHRLLHRYILREIAVPFGMILFVLTFVLLMGKILQIMDLMINKGIGFTDIALLMLYLIPSFLVFTIPISLLIAILIGLGRLSGDNEWTVMRMAGLSLGQLSAPVAWFALAAFGLTLTTTLFAVPFGNLSSRQLLFDIARQKASIGIREKVFIDDFQGILLYTESVPEHGNFLEGVLISDSRIGKEPSTIIARRAYLISNPDTMVMTLRLEDGSTHTVDAGLNHYRKLDFRFYDVRLDLAPGLTASGKAGSKSSTEMSLSEMLETIERHSLKDEALRELAIELHKKLTIPLSCLVFALIAIPLAIPRPPFREVAGVHDRPGTGTRLLPLPAERRGPRGDGQAPGDGRGLDPQHFVRPGGTDPLYRPGARTAPPQVVRPQPHGPSGLRRERARRPAMKILDRYLFAEYLRNLALIAPRSSASSSSSTFSRRSGCS